MKIVMVKGQKYNVVIWGAGVFGQKIYEDIKTLWKRQIEVIGIADNNEGLNIRLKNQERIFTREIVHKNVHKIYSSEEVKRLYSSGGIDGVMVGVSGAFYEEVLLQLENLEIPYLIYPDCDFISAAEIATSTIEIEECKAKAYILQDVYIGVDEKRHATQIYTEKGELVKESVNYLRTLGDFCAQYPLTADDVGEVLEEKICMLTKEFTHNYWHFMYEAVDRILMLEKIGFDGKYMLFDRKFVRQMIKLLRISEDRVVWIDVWENEIKKYRCNCVYCFDAIEGWKKGTQKCLYEWAKTLWADICINTGDIEYPQRLYIERTGNRRLLGAESVLKKYGFVTINPDDYTVVEQIKFFYYADIVVCAHGAATSNVMFMQDRKCLIETFGKDYIMPFCIPMMDIKDIYYQMVVEQRWIETNGIYKLEKTADYVVNDETLELAIKNSIRWISGGK